MLLSTFLVCPQPGFHKYSLYPLFIFRCKTTTQGNTASWWRWSPSICVFSTAVRFDPRVSVRSVKLPPWYKYYYKQEVYGLEFWTRLVCIWRIIPVETILMSVVCGPCFLKWVETSWSLIARPAALENKLAQPFFSHAFTLSHRSTTWLKVFLAFLPQLTQNETGDAKTRQSGQFKASSHYPLLAYC